MKKIIVTGATGFVGRHVVENLTKKGFKVISVVRDLNKARLIKSLKDSTLYEFDISDININLDVDQNTILIHCAWQNVRDTLSMIHIDKHYFDHYSFLRNIVKSKIGKLLVIGSCYEYGQQYGPVSVLTKPQPNTPYALAKNYLRESLFHLQKEYPFQFVWARLFYLYGNGQDANSIIPQFDKALENGDEFFHMSHGEQLLDYMSVEEAAEQISILINFDNGIFNVCRGSPISLRRLLENRMVEKKKTITLNLGFYNYREQDSLAIWGVDPVSSFNQSN